LVIVILVPRAVMAMAHVNISNQIYRSGIQVIASVTTFSEHTHQ